ncbi:DEAD/DEAH box helicase [Vibrio europaeus]|uniref:DEAD/DEAH box helicase n=1 Tax=Vibrio europaeus TaxID=300876 RepID=UPI00233F4FEB|nr:AAA domain-containing protein [Vibrio europaeus]MDC5853810.1 AAA domain-containing protein [Vibrio europaeus]
MTNQQRAIDVLMAWHRIEFFQVYALPSKDDEELTPRDINFQELQHQGDQALPWFTPHNLRQFGLDPEKATRYTLNLGLFDKSALIKIVDQTLGASPSSLSAQQAIEIEQRLDSEGESCFAQLTVDEHGVIDRDSLMVSTLPWALGCLLNQELASLTYGHFRLSIRGLEEYMDRVFAEHGAIANAQLISGLVALFYQWANLDYRTLLPVPDSPVPCIRLSYLQFERKPASDQRATNSAKPREADPNDVEDEDDTDVNDTTIPILNSFYIEDIERAINSIRQGTAGQGLMRYLSQSVHRHVDLYTDQALPLIAQHLSPERTPAGRWPSSPQYNMSLMQQFAVNTTFKELEQEGLMSVNGPPGTGKTTLLRDIIAENLVERAKRLAALSYPAQGLDHNGYLIASLTGFEMVVASSNNAAVENISRELPQNDSIDDDYRPQMMFFKSVANQLAARKRKGKLQPILAPEQQCWGLISAAMGAKAKRDDFSQRFFFDKYYGDNVPASRPESSDFLNLWQHFKHVSCVSFSQAKRDFEQALAAFEQARARQVRFVTLKQDLNAKQQQVLALQQASSGFVERRDRAEHQLRQQESQVASLSEQIDATQDSISALTLQRPGWFARWFNTAKSRQYNQQLAALYQQSSLLKTKRNNHSGQLATLRSELSEVAMQQQAHERQIESEQHAQRALQAEWVALSQHIHPDSVPKPSAAIDQASLQQNAYWQERAINDLRSTVFITAMTLHQAWLYEVKRHNAFKDKVFQLSDCLKAKPNELNSHKLWQILFMFVPVISTTFASLGRMFANLEEQSIGWLMIDEAGQAVPQAAIGGLWRAKRTVVVGDPLQIEPVFTAPPVLVDHLMELSLGDEKQQWSPENWSVQELADRVNPYGCSLTVQGRAKWIGIPLWVHRRCINPMFAIANKAAYQERMIHGNHVDNRHVPSVLHSQLGPNRWVQADGQCIRKQFYPELGLETLKILHRLVSQGGALKDVYVISPFKAVKHELKQYLRQHGQALQQDKGLATFIKHNIGTVHTFQGKESHTVILVLGCDRNKPGGAVWASSKPNLLNVAVTRAKKNLFVVGDSRVWADRLYFSDCFVQLNERPECPDSPSVDPVSTTEDTM